MIRPGEGRARSADVRSPDGPGDLEIMRGCVRDLVTLSALPAVWAHSHLRDIAQGCADAICGMLVLEFAHVSLHSGCGEPPVEAMRSRGAACAVWAGHIRTIVKDPAQSWALGRVQQLAHPTQSGATVRITAYPIGIGDGGLLLTASDQPGFPTEVDRMLLSACANQTAVAIQRWRTEQALHESEEQFRQFAENSSDILWIFDVATGRLEYLSAAFERVWGDIRKAVPPRLDQWAETVHPADRKRALMALDDVLLRGVTVVRVYRVVRPSDGSIRCIRDTVFPIRDQRGRIRRAGGIAQDVTQRKASLVYMVDADGMSRKDLTLDLQGAGYEVKPFVSAQDFLNLEPVLVPGCVLVAVDMPGTSGLAIAKELKARRVDLPVILMGNCHGDVKLAVSAMKAGAVDFVETPCTSETLLTAVASALADLKQAADSDATMATARQRIAALTGRERQVLEGIITGGTNKTIARDLGISPRTVEIHRAHVMERLGANTLPAAVLMAAAAGLTRIPAPGNID